MRNKDVDTALNRRKSKMVCIEDIQEDQEGITWKPVIVTKDGRVLEINLNTYGGLL